MDILSLALSRPKTIKLQDYAFGEETLEFAVLFAYMNGGGAMQADLDERFWKDVDTKRPLRFVCQADTVVIPDCEISTGRCSVMRQHDVVTEVIFEFDVVMNGQGGRLQIAICKNDGKTAALSVKVDTVEYPTT